MNKKDFDVTEENMRVLDGYFRAANYLSATQIYLRNNPLLKSPLVLSDIKQKLVGHWGTVPGQNFVYAHLDRAICKYDLNAFLISGPGHGGNFFIANSYLEGTYSKFYPEITQDENGLNKLNKQFSFPFGVSSHVAPQIPGSMHEGGELGYSLAHAYGAVLDNPSAICACIVGDGEAETGPLATSWHLNKFLNPIKDGVVLPILHLNGYKISNPTILSRISKEELTSLFVGYGYKPYFVEGDDPMAMHMQMAKTMDEVITEILIIKGLLREAHNTQRPTWPMIILRTPKGWTGPKEVNGRKVEGSFRAHQVPLPITDEESVRELEEWLKSYKPEELFDEKGALKKEYKKYIPAPERCISANPITNGGELLKELILPDVKDYGVSIYDNGEVKAQDMIELGAYIRDVFNLNRENKNFRYFSPDEALSNRLNATFEVENRTFNADIIRSDEYLDANGRIMDSYLSEHMCEGMLEGYILSGRHGFFATYEAFSRVVDSMISQHIKWVKECINIPFRRDIASLNIILTSNVWQQDHNGFTHQDPGMLDHIYNKESSCVNLLLPPDANTLICCMDHCLKTKNYVNAIVASKHPSWQWLDMFDAIKHVKAGIGEWRWAGNVKKDEEPDLVLACAGDTPTLEALACAKLLKEYFPTLKFRFINVVNLLKLENPKQNNQGIPDSEYDKLFTLDKPVIFNFHGYPKLVHEMTYKRHNLNFHVHGYREMGRITTAFDMRVLNKIDRYNLVLDVIKYLPELDKDGSVKKKMLDMLDKHNAYIAQYGVDMPEVANWKWQK